MSRLRLAVALAYAVLAASLAASSLTATGGWSHDTSWLHLDTRLIYVALLAATALVIPLFTEGFKELFRLVFKRGKRRHWWLLPVAALLQLILIVAPLVLLVGLTSRVVPRLPENPSTPSQQLDRDGTQQTDQGGGATEAEGENSDGRPTEPVVAQPSPGLPVGPVQGVLLTLAAVVILYAAVSVWLESRGLRQESGPLAAGELELLEATQKAIREVEEGGDPRAAIVSYFLKLCRLLEERGVKVSEEMTARELARAALQHFRRLERAPLERLVELFEEARYSDHRIEESMRREALACFTAIRDSLVGGVGG